MSKLLIVFALVALAVPSVWAVPLGSPCSSSDECTATTADSACVLGLCAPTDPVAVIPEGDLGGACQAGNTCNGDLVCSDARCVAAGDGATTCSETVACPDNHKCNNGVCVRAGENGDKCDADNECNDGYSCTLGYCIGLGIGSARCECLCNGETSSLAPKLPADTCSVCRDECSKVMQYTCTTSGWGIVGTGSRGAEGFSCVQPNPTTGDAETVTGNPDGTVTVTPGGELGGSLDPSAAAAVAFPSALAALAILALAVGVQL